MFIIKKSYVIKTISLFLGATLVIMGLLLNTNEIKADNQKNKQHKNLSVLANIYSCTEMIDVSFKKGNEFNLLDQESKNIYANALTVCNMLNLYDNKSEDLYSWFSLLCDYAKTNMDDIEKNTEYYQYIEQLKDITLNAYREKDLELFFEKSQEIIKVSEKTSPQDDKSIFSELEKQYSLLNNRIVADRKDITDYAKKIIGSSFSASQFKGCYIYPKAISYASNNAYANIYPSGKILYLMAEQESLNTNNNSNDDIQSKAYEFLDEYAPYADEFSLCKTFVGDNMVYCIFCPTVNKNNIKAFCYDESVTVVLGANSGNLKGFNAADYIKNHPSIHPEITEISEKEINKQNIISTDYVIVDETLYIENTIKNLSGELYYRLYNNKTEEYFTESEYMLKIK